MTDIAISVRNISKCYQVFDDQRSRLLHAVWPKHTKGMQEIWALKDINFEIKRGEAVAIIGRNGGGKSTLLEILTGTLTPTTGEVKVNGRVSGLLELGSGFNPEYSGRDNVILNGLLLGLNREEILGRFDEIEAFAEIGAAIDRPVKTYSSGMMMRLAFAVQVLCDPDILIIDEALSVGDFFFQQKCLSYIRGLCARGVTLLFVSHDMQTVRDLCKKGLYLKKGEARYWGDNLQAINSYLNDKSSQAEQDIEKNREIDCGSRAEVIDTRNKLINPIWQNSNENGYQYISAVGLYSEDGKQCTNVKIGEAFEIYILYVDEIHDPCHVTCTIKNRYGQIITTFGTYTNKISIASQGNGIKKIKIKATMMIEAGEYSLQVNLGRAVDCSTGIVKFETDWIGPISVNWNYQEAVPPFYGLVGIPVEIIYC